MCLLDAGRIHVTPEEPAPNPATERSLTASVLLKCHGKNTITGKVLLNGVLRNPPWRIRRKE